MADAVCRCGAATHAEDSHRCQNGHTLAGHPGPALKHGVRQFEQHGERVLPTDLRVSIEQFRDQLIVDKGGVANLTGVKAGNIAKLTDLEVMYRLLMADLRSRGIFTARGRVRSTFTKLLEVLDRWDRFAVRIGAEREARRVSSLSEVFAGTDDDEEN